MWTAGILKSYTLYFVLFNLFSLKRKSSKMTKRQSFMMEAKPIDKKDPNKELSNLQSK